MTIDTSHAAVQAVERQLRSHGITGEVRWLDEATPTAAAAAAALGIEVGAIANSLVFTLDDEPVLVMTSGGHRVDTAHLSELLGGKLRRASAETVRAATGQVIGGVAPTGHPAPLRTWVDTALREFPEIWAAAGHPHTVFPLTYQQLVELTGGTEVEVEPA
ncbi:YbaK/EbsC family protein [Humibacter ginsenosidimutans]|uniref:YbaK/EbsC family protein n=1 Tax=Humibacter ginsenosidimutans TaxID=2599293 RepID=A0A5B8M4A9_9MICO|nr:YbaK/EbsC family protein [Humibacter ginsenosidimutans]QDZ14809.1 YbaK/EbsC family protein [Humibacter ginsenosidimutans]